MNRIFSLEWNRNIINRYTTKVIIFGERSNSTIAFFFKKFIFTTNRRKRTCLIH